MPIPRSTTLLAALVVTTGCSSAQLQQVTLNRACTEGEGCSVTPFPRPLAVGASTFSPVELTSAAGTPALSLRASDETVIAVDGPLLVGAGNGTTAVFIENDEGVVLDFVHLSAADPTFATLGLISGVGLERLEVAPGAQTTVVASLFGGAQELLGDADEEFAASEDAFVVERVSSRRATVTAPAAGSATLTFSSLGVSASMVLEVTP